MPAKDFRADLQEAAVCHRYPRLSQIVSGDYEGSISFNFHHPESSTGVKFDVVISDVSDYPTNHNFVVFMTSGNAVSSATKALERAQNQGLFTGITINDVLNTIDRMMCNALRNHKPQSPSYFDDEDDFDNGEESMDDYDECSDDEVSGGFHHPVSQQSHEFCRHKLRTDLRVVKQAGFKFGCHGEAGGSIIVAISCQVSKLGLSEEALQTWNVLSSEYLVLLFRYPKAYQNMQEIFDMGDSATKSVEMRVGLCDSYIPSVQTAVTAFQTPPPSLETEENASNVSSDNSTINFRTLFIGSSLNKLLNERLLRIIRIRKSFGISWTGAELFFQAIQGKALIAEDAGDPKFNVPDSWLSPPPAVLLSDHFAEMGLDVTGASFPLIAWQFTLRHFIKCTEFCLVCHCKTFDEFEALKPYVCSNGLCLYQYITYGMGPSLEYEIRSQPLVVDLLISMTYARAKKGLLEDFPSGLGIRVPAMGGHTCLHSEPPNASENTDSQIHSPMKHHHGQLNKYTMTLHSTEIPRVSVGDWIVIMDTEINNAGGADAMWHCRIENVNESLTHLVLSQPIVLGRQLLARNSLPAKKDVRYVLYDHFFDHLTLSRKRAAITIILNTLPDVQTMRKFLGPAGSQRLLSSFHERITPAALDILRWIIASNRSCILQDSEDPVHLVTGMPGFIQFRLVQGAPDKEQRFIKAVKSVSMPAKPRYPTIFAWHGSPVYNWHSILREGFHFNKIAHGRACGNGVYLSSDFNTSMGYSGWDHLSKSNSAGKPGSSWENSSLEMHAVVSLNEIVNKTDRFVCRNPHFVVRHLDWIQPRYLFVGTLPTNSPARGKPQLLSVYEQDPSHRAYGPNGKPVIIPLSAVSSQRWQMIYRSPSAKTPKTSTPPQENSLEPAQLISQKDEDCESISTATEDLNILLSDSEEQPGMNNNDLTRESGKATSSKEPTPITGSFPVTDFVPGTLTGKTLSLLAPPRYATSPATRMLQKHLQATLKVQEKEILADLGWYVDPNLITTVYQWIVELHTFNSTLPLAKDLKAANLKSVVLELRFPPQFPMDPPFVRVIRPRFLPFAAGGGGHITAGGALCMELLTNSGWSPVVTIESVLLQVRLAISSTEPRPGRLDKAPQKDYSVGEAVAAFKRACLQHGWKIPSDVELMSR